MCTFGEIIEPASRTMWEDWDEDSPENGEPLIRWQIPVNVPEKICTLYILDGKFLADCVKAQPKDHLKLINASTGSILHLYQIISGNDYICTAQDYKLLQSTEIISLIKPFLSKSEDVLTIQTKPLIDYQTACHQSQEHLVRKITASTPSKIFKDLNFPFLEQPNILTGVAAGVVSLREHVDMSATALVYYIENIEEYQTDEILMLLEKFNIVKDHTAKCNSILNSNLYI